MGERKKSTPLHSIQSVSDLCSRGGDLVRISRQQLSFPWLVKVM